MWESGLFGIGSSLASYLGRLDEGEPRTRANTLETSPSRKLKQAYKALLLIWDLENVKSQIGEAGIYSQKILLP